MRFSLLLFVALLVVRGFSAELVSSPPKADPAQRSAPGETTAHRLLALELEGREAPELTRKLNELIELAVRNFAPPAAQEQEPVTARRFFAAVDAALLENGVLFPPSGRIELLRDALQPRQPTPLEFQQATRVLANARRSQAIQRVRTLGDPFFYFDCDLAAVIYISAAERLGLPVFLVEAPGHNFVRRQSPEVNLNWDPNDGMNKSDEHFAQVAGITDEDRHLLGYLENRSPGRLVSYWLMRRGQRKAGKGNAPGALADFRAAVQTASEDLVAANELAWLLATSPDPAVRDGREARAIAEGLVARSRHINWLETLAAAWSESGDFPQAIAVAEEARRRVAAWPPTAQRDESLAAFDACLKAYTQNLSYAAAIQSGVLK